MSKDTSLSSSSIVNQKFWILITLFRNLLFNMSESDILPEGLVVNQAAAEVEETVTQSTSCYHEDEDAELHMAIRMSLEEPDAETIEDTMGDNMPIDREEQAELDQALFLSNLPPDMCDEQLAELNQTRVNEANSVRESGTKVEELYSLAMQLMDHFDQSRDCTAIQSAVQLMEDVIKLTPDGHMEQARRLSDLGTALQSQFECLGKLGDIEKAILVNQQAVDLTSDSHVDKAGMFNNLGNAFFRRFQCLGKLGDIENAIFVNQQAVNLTPDGHVHKAGMLINLGNAFQSRFGLLGKLGDLENAILAKQKAVDLTPDDASKARWFSNLGSAFFNRFQCLGKLGDIENAILVNRQAVDLTPNGHAEKASRLTNLGNAFQSRFKHLGEHRDIENAVLAMQQAVDLTPDGNAGKARCLSNLGSSFQSRFESLGQLRDIENAIFVQQQAVDLTPDDHADKAGMLNNLGSAFTCRFGHLGELKDIENAILFNQLAVELTLDGHADKARMLNNLGNAFIRRFEHLGELGDIKNAILAMQQAVDLTPDSHTDKATWLNTLGSAFIHQFECLGKFEDIENAILLIEKAVDLTPDSHADKAAWLNNLGSAFSHLFNCLGKLSAIENAILVNQQAVELTPDGHADKASRLTNLGNALQSRFKCLGKLEDLSQVSLALYDVGTSRSWNIDSEIKHKGAEEEAQFHRRLAAQYEELLQKVRGLDGFGSFLMPKKFSELAPAASNGPVVIINVHDSGCDALVVCPSPPIIHVPLPMFSYGEAVKMHSELISSLRAGGVRDRETFQNVMNYEEILGKLWVLVAHPILSVVEDILYENTHDSLPHITWCATGAFAFLPLHAAGIYGPDNPTQNVNISDFVVSSYTTTLAAMLGSGSKPKQDLTKTPNVLIVSQLVTGEKKTLLPSVVKEVEVIQHYTSPDHTCHLTNESATVGAVWDEMSKYEIIHFACHGIQDTKNPLKSAFALYDGSLDLNMLMRLSLENVELAVLSACETATGDEKLPEEAVHLAAGMLAVGYPSVIATMWSICDPDAPLIADKVYANLLGHCDNSENQQTKLTPAYALHEAVKHLRKEVGEMNFVRWVPFIHFGV
ncbi:TPR-like protein [Dendrothele bispora CBS 962.96]|uniref:TPR-like protein n=1 Tax=Dendrothele bispora (strain CBS 962.96) TaxID=1314807 RepID=A0A4S8LHK7_DENBC|nr:TPR-like protein [Dendrothele bispora CBS 962.96]